MKTFLEYANEDLEELFFDLEEFAESHNIDGATLSVVMDTESVALFNSGSARGLYTAEIAFHVRSDKLVFVPMKGQFIYFDEKQYRIVDVGEAMGMTDLVLGVIESE